MEENVYEDIKNLFIISQKTTAVHQKNAIILTKYLNFDSFWDYLKKIINAIITVEKYSPHVEKVMAFFAYFCSLLKPQSENTDEGGEYSEHPLFLDIFSYLLEASQNINDTVRLRSCQLINKILDNLKGADISVELCEELETYLLQRLKDPKSVIRQQAVLAIHCLQDPCNPEDVIISELLNIMNSDPFAKIRQLCAEKIAPRKDVVKVFLNRICDVDENVRITTYKRLSCLPGFLKITERRLILGCALLDKSDKVKECLSKTLLNSWLNYYDDNIIRFIKSLRLDADETDIEETVYLFEEILNIIFKDKSLEKLTQFLPIDERKVIKVDDLDWEITSYWRIYIQYLNKNDFEEELSKILPDLEIFCIYIKEYYSSMSKEVTTAEFLEQQYKMKQLFHIVKTYDFSDPARRQCLNKLVRDILENVTLNSDVTETIISSLECSISNVHKRTQFVSEIISDILYPMKSDECQQQQQEKDYQMSVLTVKLNCLKEEQLECIREQNFIAAEQLKNEIDKKSTELTNLKNRPITADRKEKRTDIVTILKCLDIAAAILISPQVNCLTPCLKSLKESFIYELLLTENDSIRVKAFRCYALCGIIDKEIALTGIHIFSTPIFAYKNGEECDTQTLLICIGAVVDLLLVYGPQLMAAQESEKLSESNDEQHIEIFAGGTSLTDVIQGLVDLMDDEQSIIQERATIGLCKLILSDRIISPSLIARLVLKWANPLSDQDTSSVKSIIGFTLEKIALIPQFIDQLQDAVLLTVHTLYTAPRVSPLADINVENIAKFMIALCKTSEEANRVHANIGKDICSRILSKPNSKFNLIYSKILLMLDLSYNEITRRELLNACDEIRDNIHDRIIIKNITKLVTLLNVKETERCSVIREVITEE